MDAFKKHTGKVIPLPLRDVDTDQIIPAQFLTSVSREGYGENLFKRLRESDPAFVMNQERYKGGSILLTERNFGCGSSREHAVWALMGAGIRVVIGRSFADIFTSNSSKNGLLLVQLPDQTITELFSQAANADLSLTVDLESQKIIRPDGTDIEFQYDPFRRHCLLNGVDDIDYILSHRKQIEEFRGRQASVRFVDTFQ